MNDECKIEETEAWTAAEALGAAKHRRTGNIARLPRALRVKVSEMIEDGRPYAEILRELGPDGEGLDKSNLTRWREGGHKDWLAERAFIERARARQETPEAMGTDFDGTAVNHAALQMASLHVFEALRDLAPGSLDDKLGGDSAAFARLLNALARASRETMLLQKYREACAQARQALHELLDADRKLTESETRAIVTKVDDILGLRFDARPWMRPKLDDKGQPTGEMMLRFVPSEMRQNQKQKSESRNAGQETADHRMTDHETTEHGGRTTDDETTDHQMTDHRTTDCETTDNGEAAG